MRRILGALGVLTIIIGGGAAAGATVGGDISEPQPRLMTVDPTAGPPASTFEVSGDGCLGKGEDESRVEVSAPDTVETGGTATTTDGAWSLTLTVPDDAEAGATIDIDAICVITPMGEQAFQTVRGIPNQEFTAFEYDRAQFTVTATPTTEPPADDDETEVEDEDEVADEVEVDATAAEPTVAQPTFTG